MSFGAWILIFFAMALAPTAQAQGPEVVDPIGRHFRLFRFEKNENPQNILVGFTKVARNCRFELSQGKPIVDFYWLLDGTRFKNPHGLIKKSIRKRIAFADPGSLAQGETDRFALELLEAKDMKAPIKSALILVSAKRTVADCEISVVATFGDAKGNQNEIKLSTIRAETRKIWMPPFRKVISITLEGESVKDGRRVAQVFH